MELQTVLFIGPQGSGKGTQVQNLISYLKENDGDRPVMDVETGRLFRALAETGNATALHVKELIENGRPVPDFVTNSFVMADFRDRYTPESHITLDGFPRNAEQAKFLDQIFGFYGRTCMTIVYLETPEEIVRERMMARGRSDDTAEKITERLRWSTEMMNGLIAYYKTRPETKFVTVDGSQTIEEVQVAIKAGLNI